ncbi:hypothetical protein M0802_002303 [Mischocyttarus mexicanus]|nr:hypothetical protein M0802_002303 [Mischocyttarus mexicanus]
MLSVIRIEELLSKSPALNLKYPNLNFLLQVEIVRNILELAITLHSVAMLLELPTLQSHNLHMFAAFTLLKIFQNIIPKWSKENQDSILKTVLKNSTHSPDKLDGFWAYHKFQIHQTIILQ